MAVRQRVQHVFSTDLLAIEAEITDYLHAIGSADLSAGNALLEIGKRLAFVKEHSVSHGEWLPWLNRMGIEKRTAQRYMRAADLFGKTSLAPHLSASTIFELLSLPPTVDKAAFLSADHVIPSTGEIKPVTKMTRAEVREIVRVERERAGLIKSEVKPPISNASNTPPNDSANPFDTLTLDADKRALLDELPLRIALLAVKLDVTILDAFLAVAAELSGTMISEHYDDIVAKLRSGTKPRDIVRPYKKAPNKQSLSTFQLVCDPYEILDIYDGDSEVSVKRKYRELVKRLHPDAGGSEFLFKIVNVAWEEYKRIG